MRNPLDYVGSIFNKKRELSEYQESYIINLVETIAKSNLGEYYEVPWEGVEIRIIKEKKENKIRESPIEIPKKPETEYYYVSSPCVGTLHLTRVEKKIVGIKTRSEKPYVSVGDKIKEGQVLATVEYLNIRDAQEIKSDQSGILEEILVEDEFPVQFNKPPIFKIRLEDKK